jgi:hypothetical protein
MYTKEELEIVDYMENGNPTPVPNLHDKIDKIYQTLLNSVLHKYITGQLVDKSRIA